MKHRLLTRIEKTHFTSKISHSDKVDMTSVPDSQFYNSSLTCTAQDHLSGLFAWKMPDKSSKKYRRNVPLLWAFLHGKRDIQCHSFSYVSSSQRNVCFCIWYHLSFDHFWVVSLYLICDSLLLILHNSEIMKSINIHYNSFFLVLSAPSKPVYHYLITQQVLNYCCAIFRFPVWYG
jgi:hypothetical protein